MLGLDQLGDKIGREFARQGIAATRLASHRQNPDRSLGLDIQMLAAQSSLLT
ncbi:hypothetical protein NKH81_14745 [Mesorhizobium sp. M0959]|uniref:hypothetical protein n=1 Tax=unclassified Mesorhizobium TaxID=325217 RepID=UPI00333A0B32